MNPYAWMGEGVENRMSLSRLRYDSLNQFIFENNQPSHRDGIQLQGNATHGNPITSCLRIIMYD